MALIIGNNAYHELPERMQLTSPKNDATDVAAALKRLGYPLVYDAAFTDASRETMTAGQRVVCRLSKAHEVCDLLLRRPRHPDGG